METIALKYPNKTFRLKNNEKVTIRMCTESDAENLISTIKEYLADSEYIPLSSEEFDPTLEQEKEQIKNFIRNDNSLLLIALDREGNLIGNIDLTGSQRKITRHTGMIGMGILKSWRNTGLGSLLIAEMIAWAEQNPILELVWLEVYEENHSALRIYTRAGFEENGRQSRFFKRDSDYSNKITMVRGV